MSENRNTGCSLWVVLVTVIIGNLFLIGSTNRQITTTKPTFTPSNSPLVITLTPQYTEKPFVVQNNQITYVHFPNLGQPCYYMISGVVVDLNGNPFTSFVINIKMVDIDEVAPEGPGYAFPADGAFAEDGPSGYATLLPSWQVSYEVWLTKDIGGEEISPHILVPTQDCYQNRAIVNFVQTRPIP